MRVALVMRDMATMSGSRVLISDLGRALVRAGIDTTTICMHPLHAGVDPAGLAVVDSCDGRIARATAMMNALETAHDTRPIDLVHASYTHGLLAAYAFNCAYDVPYVVQLHGGEMLKTSAAKWKESYFRVALTRASAITSVAAHLPQQLSRSVGLDLPDVDIIHAGVDPDWASGTWRKVGSLRDRLGLGGDSRLAVFAGRMEALKGPEVFLETCEMMMPTDAKLHYVMIGSGPLEDKLRSWTRSHGWSERVHWLGGLPHHEMPGWLAQADVVVTPSTLTEGSGNSVMVEAMCAGTPVIATTVPSVPDLITHGDNGLLARPNDKADLGRQILRILGDQRLARRVVHGGRLTAAAHSWSKITEAYLACYRRVIERHESSRD